jgi:anti-sigma factor RsiW
MLRAWQEGGILAAADLDAVERHCAACAACAACAREFSALLPFVQRDVRGVPVDPSAGPSGTFTDAVMARVGQRAPARSSPQLGWILATAASVVLLAGIGFGAYRLGTGRATGEVLVRFQLAAPGAGSVALVGSFTGWETSKLPMADTNRDGVWEISVRLRKDAVHTYNFLIDGTRWVPDPAAEGQVDDGFGGRSSIVSL